MSGAASFGHSCRIGNWSEDMELHQARLKDFVEKKESGSLVVSRMQAKFAHHLQPTPITSKPDGALAFGDNVMLWNLHAEGFVATDQGDKETRADGATHTSVTATKYKFPCARSTMIIARTTNDGFATDDSALHYGQVFRIATCEPLGTPSYLHSYPFSPTQCSKFSRLQEATFSSAANQYTLWKVLHVNPQERLESEGEAVPVRTAVVLCHICTSSLLAGTAVSYPNDFSIEHGDTEVAVKSYQTLAKGSMGSRDHAFEGSENHFVFVCDGAEGTKPADSEDKAD